MMKTITHLFLLMSLDLVSNHTNIMSLIKIPHHHQASRNSIFDQNGKYIIFEKWSKIKSGLKQWNTFSTGLLKHGKLGQQYTEIERVQTNDSLGCEQQPSLRTLKFLGRICEDCYTIYRDVDVFQMCRY